MLSYWTTRKQLVLYSQIVVNDYANKCRSGTLPMLFEFSPTLIIANYQVLKHIFKDFEKDIQNQIYKKIEELKQLLLEMIIPLTCLISLLLLVFSFYLFQFCKIKYKIIKIFNNLKEKHITKEIERVLKQLNQEECKQNLLIQNYNYVISQKDKEIFKSVNQNNRQDKTSQ